MRATINLYNEAIRDTQITITDLLKITHELFGSVIYYDLLCTNFKVPIMVITKERFIMKKIS